MSAQHTQGPWWMPEDSGVVYAGRKGDYTCPIVTEFIFDDDKPEDRALMVAAPELLQALIDMLAHGTPGDRARAVLAIKKAAA